MTKTASITEVRLEAQDPLSAPELVSTVIAAELGISGPTNWGDLFDTW